MGRDPDQLDPESGRLWSVLTSPQVRPLAMPCLSFTFCGGAALPASWGYWEDSLRQLC